MITHGMSFTREYQTWDNMIGRCERPNHRYYDIYGGRGIKVCSKWRNSFEAFYEDMGDRPSDSHSLDRIDPNGDYEPSNCRWATSTEQNMNLRRRKDNKSGYRGVSWDKPANKWRTVVFFDGKQIHVGTFKDKETAAYMYDQFALQLYGDIVRTNFEYV